MACTKNVYNAFDEWLGNLGIKRNYSANIRSLNKHYLSAATGTADFPQLLYDNVLSNSDFCLNAVCGLVFELINHEQQSGSKKQTLSVGYLSDCKSAFKKFFWFLKQVQKTPACSSNSLAGNHAVPLNIVWSADPRKDMNISQRLTTQDRLNNQKEKPANFPIRLIDQLANNAAEWAREAGLPDGHPAYSLQEQKNRWLEDSVNDIVFLIEDNKQVVFSNIEQIGTAETKSGHRQVYVRLKGNGSVHQVMSRSAKGNIKPMILKGDDGLNAIALDHVYRMEDILADLGDAFPFLKELTALFRKLNKGNIRGTETRKAVKEHIHKNFKKVYASRMQTLISELNKLGRICSLEAMYKKDNLEKH